LEATGLITRRYDRRRRVNRYYAAGGRYDAQEGYNHALAFAVVARLAGMVDLTHEGVLRFAQDAIVKAPRSEDETEDGTVYRAAPLTDNETLLAQIADYAIRVKADIS
jgi:hypothetical protein